MKRNHPFQPYSPLILNCAPVGFIPTKELNPNVPLNVEEIIMEGLNLAKCCVSIIHLHARDESGRPTWDKRIYQKIILGIREKNSDVILCVTTSGRIWTDFARRSEVLELEGDAKPDMASLTLGSMNFIGQSSMNSPEMIRALAGKMMDRGIKPELEVFDVGMLSMTKVLQREGLITGRPYINIILGNLGTAPADLGVLSMMVDQADREDILSIGGLGLTAFPAQLAGFSAGLHIRFGLEDSMYLDFEKKEPATNFSLLDRLIELARLARRPIARATDVRHILEI